MTTSNTILFIFLSTILIFSHKFIYPTDPQVTVHLLLFFPLLIFISRNSYSLLKVKKSSKPILVILIISTFLYISFNWYFKSFPYYGNRAFVKSWLSIISYLFGVFLINSKASLKLFQKSLIIILSIASIYSIFQYLSILNSVGNFQKDISGHIGHKNIFSILALISIIFHTYNYFINENTFKNKPLNISVFLILLVGILISNSRSAQFLTFFSLFTITIFYIKSSILFFVKKYWLYILIILSSLLFVIIICTSEEYAIRLTKLFINTGVTDNTRSILFKTQWKLFIKSPITGVGLGNFPPYFVPLRPTFFKQQVVSFLIPTNGHNEFLETLCEIGIVGFILLYSIWFFSIKSGLKYNTNYNPILFSLMILIIHSTFSISSRRTPSLQLLWFLIGILANPQIMAELSTLTLKFRKYLLYLILIINIFILSLWGQLQYGDYTYLNIKRKQLSGAKIEIEELKNAIEFCPYHPNLLFHMSFISMRENYCSFALETADYIDKITPNLKPTDMIRAQCAFNNNDFYQAEYYIKNLLITWPNTHEARELLALVYSKTNQCQKLKNLKGTYLSANFDPNIKIEMKNYNTNNAYFLSLRKLNSQKNIYKMECNE